MVRCSSEIEGRADAGASPSFETGAGSGRRAADSHYLSLGDEGDGEGGRGRRELTCNLAVSGDLHLESNAESLCILAMFHPAKQ